MVHNWSAIFIQPQCFTHVRLTTFTAVTLAQKITLRPQMVELLKVKDRTLSQQEVLSDILLMVPILHLFLVNVINEFLDLVLIICALKCDRIG